MSIRLTSLYIYVAILLVYAWKDWFKSLCGLILLMAIMHHEDMPREMFGIQGFNLWNILFLGIFLAWLVNRRREGLTWDMPRHINVLLLMYMGVYVVAFLRAVLDRSYIENYPLKSLVSEELINTVKWVLPGILLYDGCRTRRRVVMALVCVLAMYCLLAIWIIKRLPLDALLGADKIGQVEKMCRRIGYNRCDMSTFFAGVFWGIVAFLPLVSRKKYLVMVLLSAASIVALVQAMTGGRAGYLAWGATGMVLCLLKWRKYLILAPVIVILLPIVFPGPVERMLEGFGAIDVAGKNTMDDNLMTSGRTVVWPYVIDKIGESPMIGYGRLAMKRTGLHRKVSDYEFGGHLDFAHPHNMYLETLLDNGILGSIPIFLFWGIVIIYSARLFRSDNRLYSSVGGVALSFILTQLFAGIGSQHFYPLESTFGMWTAIFLAIRVYVERKRVEMDVIATENSWSNLRFSRQVAISSVHTCGLL